MRCEHNLPSSVPEVEPGAVSQGLKSRAPTVRKEAGALEVGLLLFIQERLVNTATCFSLKGQVQTDKSDRLTEKSDSTLKA